MKHPEINRSKTSLAARIEAASKLLAKEISKDYLKEIGIIRALHIAFYDSTNKTPEQFAAMEAAAKVLAENPRKK